MSEESSVSTGNRFGISNWLSILLSLGAIGFASLAVYKIYHLGSAEARLSATASELERELLEQGTNIDVLLQRFGELKLVDQVSVSRQLREFGELIEADLETMRAQLSTSPRDWLFAEVEYLVRMANQRVLMERDVTSALQLLLSADRILRDEKGLTAHDLRRALTNDILTLQAVKTRDDQGTYLKLSALISQVKFLRRDLPTFENISPSPEKTPVRVAALDQPSKLVAQASERLGSLFDFRRHDTKVRPIPPPIEIYYLRQNLILKLQMAQMALFEGNGVVYQRSLVEALDWITNSFDEDTTREVMTHTLEELIALEVGGELPDISASLEQIRSIMVDFNKE